MKKVLKQIDTSNLTPMNKRNLRNFKKLVFSRIISATNPVIMASFCAYLEWSVKKYNSSSNFDIITEFATLDTILRIDMEQRMAEIQELKKLYRRNEIGLKEIEDSDKKFVETIARKIPNFTKEDLEKIMLQLGPDHQKKLSGFKQRGIAILWISGGIIGTVLGILFAIFFPNFTINSNFRLGFSSIVGFFLFDKFLSIIMAIIGQSNDIDRLIIEAQYWKKYKTIIFEAFRVILFFLSIFFVLYRWNLTISLQQLWILLIFGLFCYVFPVIISRFVMANLIQLYSGTVIRLPKPKNLWSRVTVRVETKTLWLFFLITFILLSLNVSIGSLNTVESPLLIASLVAIVYLVLPSIFLARVLNNGFPHYKLQSRVNIMNYGFYLLFFLYTFLSIIYVIISVFIPAQSVVIDVLQDVGIFALIGSGFLAFFSMLYRRGLTKLQESYLWIIGHVRNDVISFRKSQSTSNKTEILSEFEKMKYRLLQEKCEILIDEYSSIRNKKFKLIWDTWIDLNLVPLDLVKKENLSQSEYMRLQEFQRRVLSTQNSFGRTFRYTSMFKLQKLSHVESVHQNIEQKIHQLPLLGDAINNLNEVLSLYDEVFNLFDTTLIPIQKNERETFWTLVLKFLLSLVIPVILNMIVVPLLISVF
jgi:hypothetical protein